MPPWLIIMDEPTNHLDIESVELLEQALRAFDGALLVVSDDPSFLERVRLDREVKV
jgi:ATPase subunit of ABC transporter with duplicated ATPase domains